MARAITADMPARVSGARFCWMPTSLTINVTSTASTITMLSFNLMLASRRSGLGTGVRR